MFGCIVNIFNSYVLWTEITGGCIDNTGRVCNRISCSIYETITGTIRIYARPVYGRVCRSRSSPHIIAQNIVGNSSFFRVVFLKSFRITVCYSSAFYSGVLSVVCCIDSKNIIPVIKCVINIRVFECFVDIVRVGNTCRTSNNAGGKSSVGGIK